MSANHQRGLQVRLRSFSTCVIGFAVLVARRSNFALQTLIVLIPQMLLLVVCSFPRRPGATALRTAFQRRPKECEQTGRVPAVISGTVVGIHQGYQPTGLRPTLVQFLTTI